VAARERAFLEALSSGREPSEPPSIQDLERYALDCRSLIPQDPAGRAAIAQMIGKKYRFTKKSIPSLRKTLGLDSQEVIEAFQNQTNQPLKSIYAERLTARERLSWTWSTFEQKLESLPPFWTAFSLTFTETVGATVLALPIALAGVGPLAGVVILVVLGIVNILTIMGVVEAITRNGNIRYGTGYYGRLVDDYLGPAGRLIASILSFIPTILVCIVFYMGVAYTLASSTGIPVAVWAALIFLTIFYVLRRDSLDATVASALLTSMISISLLVILMLLALPHIQVSNLAYTHIPFINAPFDPTILQLIFGIVIGAYFGHTSAANAAKVVLRRDPGGKSLMWGNIAAMSAVMLLYVAWVIIMGGAIAPGVLAATAGTMLKPLAEVGGEAVYVFGGIYVVLSMGIAILHMSLGLSYQVREWLPVVAHEIDTPPAGLVRHLIYLATRTTRGRFWLGFTPAIICFLIAEGLLLTGQESFSGLLSLVGVIVVPVLGGIFPMLMLVASRRRGDYVPGLVVRFLDSPAVVAGIYLLYLTSLVMHGLFILQSPLDRIIVLASSAVIVIMTVIMFRRSSFDPQTVIEVRYDKSAEERVVFNVVDAGQPLKVNVALNQTGSIQHLETATGEFSAFIPLESAVFELPVLASKTLKVWVHQLTEEGISEGVWAIVTVKSSLYQHSYDLNRSGGQVVLPLHSAQYRIEIRFPEHEPESEVNDVIDQLYPRVGHERV
jgi:amino acid permease